MSISNKTRRKPEAVEQVIDPARHEYVPQETLQPTVVDFTPTPLERDGHVSAEAETRAIAYEIYRARRNMGKEGDELGDWLAAESRQNLRDEYYGDLGPVRENEMKMASVRSGDEVPPT